MSLRAYLRILRERRLTIIAFVLAATVAAVVVTFLTPKSYEATAQVLVQSSTPADAAVQAQANSFVTYQVPTYAKVIGSPEVTKYIQNRLRLGLSERTLKGKIRADAESGQALINVTASDSSSSRAAELANAAAAGLRSAVQGYSSSVKLFVTGPAEAPSSPVSPTPLLNIVLGFVLGLVFGVAVAVLRDLLDNRVKDAEALGKIVGAPAMGVVVEDDKTDRHPIAGRSGAQNIRAENFRQLRANLQFANVDDHPRVIAVTSSIPGEGKTTIAVNLAATLAEAGFSVCLVDADLRRPNVAKVLGLSGAVGLTNVLIQQVSLTESLQSAGPNLYVLASGPTPPNPSEVLASTYVRDAIRALLETIDYVVIDTAPLLPVADGSEVAALADGTLLVARHSVTTDAQVKHSVQALTRVDARILGVLLNRVPVKRGNRDYGYEYYRNPEDDQSLQGDDRPSRKANRADKKAEKSAGDFKGTDRTNGSRAKHRPDDAVASAVEGHRS